MILYSLRCQCGHEFDQWFENMADFDTRKERLTCPACNGHQVSKAIMAPRVGKSKAEPALPPCGAAGCGGGACPMMG
jgi:hypothetical protein